MKAGRALAALALLAGAGCWRTTEAPEEHALDVFEWAEADFAAQRYESAVTRYEYVILHRNRWKEPYYKLARCHEAMGKEEQGVRVLEQLLQVDPSDAQGKAELGRLQARVEAMRKP